MQISLITMPGYEEPRICSTILAEGLGITHKSLITTIKRHLSRIERFGRVLLRKAPLKTSGGNQLVTLTDLNENQALFIGSLSENTEQVLEFKVMLIHEFDKARKALAEYAHTTVLQRQEALISLCNTMIERVVGLETRFDRMHTYYGDAHRANVDRADERALEVRIMREKILTYVTTSIRRSLTWNWDFFWDRFKVAYNIDVRELSRKNNEFLLDTAIRHGYLNQLWEFVNVQ